MFTAAQLSRFNALNPTLFQFFTETMREVPMVRDRLYNVQNSRQSAEYFEGVGTMPTDAFRQYKKTEVIGQSRATAGFGTNFRHEEYPLDIVLRYADVRDMNSVKMRLETQAVADAFRSFLEEEAASIFNNGFDADYEGADGKPLFSTAHPHSPDNTKDTWSNAGTTALSEDSIRSTRLAMRTWKDANGAPAGIMPNAIVIPPGLADDAEVLMRSALKPGSQNNDANIIQNKFEIIEWQYLTDSNNWFMVDLRAAQRFLLWFNRENMTLRPKPQESNQVTVKYGMLSSFSYGYISPRFAYGHNVS